MVSSILTVGCTDGFSKGGKVTMLEKDNRVLMRAWYFVTFRNPPHIETSYYITGIIDGQRIAIAKSMNYGYLT